MQKLRKLLSIIISVVLISGNISTILGAPDYTHYMTDTLNGYYKGAENAVLDDWEELMAAAASGADLREYVLPGTDTGFGSTTVITALIKGDLDAAENAAESMVSGGELISVYYAYGDAINMLAIEAYNRSAPHGRKVDYNKNNAVSTLLSYQETDGGFGDGELGHLYSSGDTDTTGLALCALSLYGGSAEPYSDKVLSSIADAVDFLQSAQQSNGGFLGWSGNNSNSAAAVISGIVAIGEDPAGSGWERDGATLADALLSFYVSGGGFGATDDSEINAFATKQALLALSDLKNGSSYLASLSLGAKKYLGVTVQTVVQGGGYGEKQVTIYSDETLDDAIDRALGTDSDISDYAFHINGAEELFPASRDISDGDKILAIHKDYTDAAYFQPASGYGFGVNEARIGFGESAELTLMSFASGSPMPGIPIDINGDGMSDGKTDGGGKITISPVEAQTHNIYALRAVYEYDAGTGGYVLKPYIESHVAILPGKVTMSSGDVQTATVSIQIEGKDGNILYDPIYTAGNGGEKLLTVYDAVTGALFDKGIPYTASGGYISAIDGVAAASGGDGYGWDGWVYNIIEERYLNGSEFVSGMADTLISDGDKIVVYYCNYDCSTLYPLLETTLKSDGSLTVEITAYQTDYSTYITSLAPVPNVEIIWAKGTAREYATATDAEGLAVIPAANVITGANCLQIDKTDAYGLPSVVRLIPNYTVIIGGGGGGDEPPVENRVYITVTGPEYTLLPKTSYLWYSGLSVMNLLRGSGLSLEYGSGGSYVSSIEGISEYDYGPGSGWLYMVNGDKSITLSASAYTLSPWDAVVWYYTLDYTREEGGWGSGAAPQQFQQPQAPVPEESKEGTPAEPVFSDVPAGHWAFSHINYLAEKKVLNGTGDNRFEPEGGITRGQFVTILALISGDTPPDAEGLFSDVSSADWFGGYVAWAYKNNIAFGIGGGLFSPSEVITVQDMAVMIMRFAEARGVILVAEPTDSGYLTYVPPYARAAVSAVLSAGILHDTGKAPGENATRAEAAAMAAALAKLIFAEA